MKKNCQQRTALARSRAAPTVSAATPWPTTMAELVPSERVVVRAFRRWVVGLCENTSDPWSFAWNDFARQFGTGDGRQALSGLARLVKGLQCHARRAVRYHQPCCPCLCVDEVCVLSLVAASQHRRRRLARALAEWLVLPDGVGDLLEAGGLLATVMRRHGLDLPDRSRRDDGAADTCRPVGPRRVVH